MSVKLAKIILIFIAFLISVSMVYMFFNAAHNENFKNNGTFVFYGEVEYGDIH